MGRSLEKDLNNPSLFLENEAGHYSYTTNSVGGKTASGQLHLSDNPERDNKAQRDAGADQRRTKGHEWGADDGGHLIGARFGGRTGDENLTAQNSNLNRQDYKSLENKWAKYLEESKGKVFVNIEANDPNRPTAYMGYAIYEAPDGTRSFEVFDFTNESRKEQGKWDRDTESYYAEGDLVGKEYDDDSFPKEQFSSEKDAIKEQERWEQDTDEFLNNNEINAIQATIANRRARHANQGQDVKNEQNAIVAARSRYGNSSNQTHQLNSTPEKRPSKQENINTKSI